MREFATNLYKFTAHFLLEGLVILSTPTAHLSSILGHKRQPGHDHTLVFDEIRPTVFLSKVLHFCA